MTAAQKNLPAVLGRDLHKTFRRENGEVVHALDGISLEAAYGALTALVGPDGAGKTTLIRLAAGLMTADGGTLNVLGLDVSADPQEVQDRIGYMPQKFGLYEDLTVQENLDLYADLHGVTADERRTRYARLMEMTALGPFTNRLAGQLSGGMKQKLGLACTLVRAPELLLLDEPTVGVDPLSRRELWEIILQLVNDQGLTVLLSTSYLDEAERCGHVVVLHEGKLLAQGPPADISGLAAGRTFCVTVPPGQKASSFQARLLDHPGVLDAVPEAGRVRIVTKRQIRRQGQTRRQGDKETRSEGAELELDNAEPVEPRFEDGFMVLLKSRQGEKGRQGDTEKGRQGAKDRQGDTETRRQGDKDRQGDTETRRQGEKDKEAPASRSEVLSPSLLVSKSPCLGGGSGAAAAPVVEVRGLVRCFGKFTAVDHISFEVYRGEIFGLLGPNGAGKTTTFRMLCGLLPATSGTLRVAGVDLRTARASARQRIGYVAQKFSLYAQLSVAENLDFFAGAYGLRGAVKEDRIQWALREFGLSALADLPSGELPGGYKQRLAMAAALLHGPEILFLDEPTSGVDPLARREFWRRITALAEDGVTVIVTTHFMEEAEYCDRIVIMDAGRVLAQGTPAEVRRRASRKGEEAPTMEEAFIEIVEQARRSAGGLSRGAAA